MYRLFDDFFDMVYIANPKRKFGNSDRRLLKMYEEAGEMVQAFLHVTSKSNAKRKTWADVREEGIDTVVPIIDVMLTPISNEDVVALVKSEFRRTRLARHPKLNEKEILAFFRKAAMVITAHQTLKDKVKRNARFVEQSRHKFRLTLLGLLVRLLNMLMAEMPDQQGIGYDDRAADLRDTLARKLEKWQKNRRDRHQVTEDDV